MKFTKRMITFLLSAVMVLFSVAVLPGTAAKAETGGATTASQFNVAYSVHVTESVSMYSFYATDNGYGNVTFINDVATSGIPINIRITDNRSKTIYDEENKFQYDTGDLSITAGHTYYIYINTSYWECDGYLEFDFAHSNAWETESNETFDDADAVTENSPITGNMGYENDKDIYAFSEPTDCLLSVDFGPEKAGEHGAWNLNIYTSDGKKSSLLSNVIDEKYITIYLQKGIYYFEVTGTSPSAVIGINYNLSFNSSSLNLGKPSITRVYGYLSLGSNNKTTLNLNGVLLSDEAVKGVKYKVKASASKSMKSVFLNKSFTASGMRNIETSAKSRTKKGKSIKKFYFTVQPYVSDLSGVKHYGTTSKVKAQSFKIK